MMIIHSKYRRRSKYRRNLKMTAKTTLSFFVKLRIDMGGTNGGRSRHEQALCFILDYND